MYGNDKIPTPVWFNLDKNMNKEIEKFMYPQI